MNNSPPTGTRLRMVNWNLWWQFGPWQQRAPAILATLKQLDADILTLQEVWDDGSQNFAEQLANDLGYHFVYAPGARPNGIYMGNAILSRWPIESHEILSLYDDEKSPELRVALYAQVNGPRGKIPVFCTHLNWQAFHSAIRQKQVNDLAQFISRTRPWIFPPVIGGDFNADPQSDEIRMMTGQTASPVDNLVFHDAWSFAGDASDGYTWNNDNPHATGTLEANRRIDYIFAGWPRPNGLGHIVKSRVVANSPVNGVWPSDHYAVLAEFRY
ncbi:MAG: endonuclease/exonuclease/phosphatase family protein [Paracoccaceae bacterium]